MGFEFIETWRFEAKNLVEIQISSLLAILTQKVDSKLELGCGERALGQKFVDK